MGGWAVLDLQETPGSGPPRTVRRGAGTVPVGYGGGMKAQPQPPPLSSPGLGHGCPGRTFFQLAHRPCRAHGPLTCSTCPVGASVRSWRRPRAGRTGGPRQPRWPRPMSSFPQPGLGAETRLVWPWALSPHGVSIPAGAPASSQPGPRPTQSPGAALTLCVRLPSSATVGCDPRGWPSPLRAGAVCMRRVPAPHTRAQVAPSAFQTP